MYKLKSSLNNLCIAFPYLPWTLWYNSDLGIDPFVCLISYLCPNWSTKSSSCHSIHVQSSHGSTIHVIPESQTGPWSWWVSGTNQTSFLISSSGWWCFNIYIVTYWNKRCKRSIDTDLCLTCFLQTICVIVFLNKQSQRKTKLKLSYGNIWN